MCTQRRVFNNNCLDSFISKKCVSPAVLDSFRFIQPRVVEIARCGRKDTISLTMDTIIAGIKTISNIIASTFYLFVATGTRLDTIKMPKEFGVIQQIQRCTGGIIKSILVGFFLITFRIFCHPRCHSQSPHHSLIQFVNKLPWEHCKTVTVKFQNVFSFTLIVIVAIILFATFVVIIVFIFVVILIFTVTTSFNIFLTCPKVPWEHCRVPKC